MLKVEVVVRGYITGSAWKDYQKSGKVCGIQLPTGLLYNQKLPEPIFTPSTKASLGSHDENIAYEQVIQMMGNDLFQQVKSASIKIYKMASEYAIQRGIIIADTKMEFGLKDGILYIGDEILTPDSSRFWDVKTFTIGIENASYDKQVLRNDLICIGYDKKTPIAISQDTLDKTRSKYIKIYQILTDCNLE